MISCQILNCKEEFISANSYIIHLKRTHFLKHRGKFNCPKDGCNQHFQHFNRFAKHLNLCIIPFSARDESVSGNLNGSPNQHSSSLHCKLQNSYFQPENIDVDQGEDETIDIGDEMEIEDQPVDFTIDPAFILNLVLKFVLGLHAMKNFTRKDVFNIQDFIVSILFNNIIEIITQITYQKDCNCHTKDIVLDILKDFIRSFNSVSTDYLLKKKLEELNLAKDLDNELYEFTINKEVGVVFKEGVSKFEEISSTGMMMPLRFQIKEFLSRFGKLNEIFENMKKFSGPSAVISHYFQGSTWKAIRTYFSHESVIIPIGIYTDGMQFNNSLGKHTDSTDMFYYFYPGLNDPLNRFNVHLASVIRSKFIKEYKNAKSLASLVKELYSLFMDGIDFEIEGKIVNIKFVLGLIIGDNLALNAILDYIIGFRGNFYCRICKVSRLDAEKLCEELISELRNRFNYEDDVNINDPSLTGVVNNSMFNILPYFHCTLNLSLDLMHDFFEGIFQYVICHSILYFIEKKFFTLAELNEIINNFSYGSDDIKYIPNILTKKNLEDCNLKMTAREAWQFLYLLPLYIGNKIDCNDEVWILLKTLLQIIELLLGSSFDEISLGELNSLIKKHNALYIKYFGSLKPKMHLITHLVTSIKAMGPPRHYMSLRMEMMHIYFKVYAHCTPNRKNISKSFCIKYSLYFANLLLNGPQKLDIECGKEINTQFESLKTLKSKYFKTVNYRGTDYKSGMFLPLMELGSYHLYEILEIQIYESETLSIICKNVGDLTFDEHILSYKLKRNCTENIRILPLKCFNSIPLYIYKYNYNFETIRPKIFFQQI